jgi:hypothetical protein
MSLRTTTDLPPGIAERYSSAIDSGNLRLGERRGDVDMIIAAGLAPNGLASALFRLLVEYDAVRSEHVASEARMRSQELMASRETGEDDQTGETAEERSAKILLDAEHDALTAHAMILVHLTSLRDAKERFGAFAIEEARRRRMAMSSRDVMVLAGRALDVVMRPTCRRCDGRGYNGGTTLGEPTYKCGPCKGTGHRRDSIGRDDTERLFAGHLLMQTDALLAQAQGDIAFALRKVDDAKAMISAATAAG